MLLFARTEWLTPLMLGAVAVVIGWLLLRTHRYLSRQKRGDSPLVRVERPHRTEHGHHLDAPPEVLRWEVQMHETARELSAQLDSKMRALQALVAEADRAAARLEAAGKPPDATRQPVGPDPRPATQAEALRATGSSDRATGNPDQTSPRRSARARQEEICTLADYGLDAAEIARRTGSPVGEVELILGLREQK